MDSGKLSAKTFLSHIDWSALRRETMVATWDAQQKMFEVTLPTEHLGSQKIQHSKRKA